MRFKLVVALSCLICAGPAFGDVIVDEDFSAYVDGDLSGQGNWGGHGGDGTNPNVWVVDDATDSVAVNTAGDSAWLGTINFTPMLGPAEAPGSTYKITMDFSFESIASSNHSLINFGLARDVSMAPFPNGNDDFLGRIKYNQWPNPNTDPFDQTTFKFLPSNRLDGTDDENPNSALVPESELGINVSDFDPGFEPIDLQSDMLRVTWEATHLSGDDFEVMNTIENLDTGFVLDSALSTTTIEYYGEATELTAGFRTMGMDNTQSFTIYNWKVEGPAVPGGGGDGDFNDDTFYDCADVDALTTEIAIGGMDLDFDMNGDGAIDGGDLDAWLTEAGAVNNASGGPHLLGDANLDGVVDVGDFNVWNSNKFTNNSNWCSGDFNADGVIDVGDFNAWNANKFTSSDAAAAVPEPMAAFSLLTGMLVLLGWRRRN